MKGYAAITSCVLGILSCSGLAQASSVNPATAPLLSQSLEVQPSPPLAFDSISHLHQRHLQLQCRGAPNSVLLSCPPGGQNGAALPLVIRECLRWRFYGQSQGNWTLEQLYETTLFVYRQQGAEITFSELDGNQFTISAIDPEGAVLYTRKLFHEDNLLTLGLFYDVASQAALEPVVDYIAESFQPI